MIIKCPSCQTELEVTEEMIGRNLRCSVCNAKFNLSDESSVRSQKKTTEQGFEPPHRDSPVMRNLKEIILIVFAIVCLTLAKVYSHELYERFWPGAKEYLNSKMLKDEIKDLQERFERYGQTIKTSGILDLYSSETQKELRGEINQRKYRVAIENSLAEARRLNTWCKQRIQTFDPVVPDGDQAKVKSWVKAGHVSICQLSALGIDLYEKTLECHRVCCGSKDGGTERDAALYRNMVSKITDSRNISEKTKVLIDNLCHDVLLLVVKYSDLEAQTIKKLSK